MSIALLLEVILLYISYELVGWFHFAYQADLNPTLAFRILLFQILGLLLVAYLSEMYSDFGRKKVAEILSVTMISNTVLYLVTVASLVLINGNRQSVGIAAILYGCNLVFQIVFRLVLLILVQRTEQQSEWRVSIIAANDFEGETLSSECNLKFGNRLSAMTLLVPPYTNWEECIHQSSSIILGSNIPRADRDRFINLANHAGKKVYVVLDAVDLLLMPKKEESIGQILTLSYGPLMIPHYYCIVKRVMDVATSILLIALCLPVILVLLAVIPITSPGPALYTQIRVGRMGKPFKMYKFRSMVSGAEASTGPVLAAEDDPRVTSTGRLIRACRLDELPQLMNVLKGDMSLVGPRPERPEFVQEYEQTIDGYRKRHGVHPGITGLGQVRGNYFTSPADKLRYDLWYIRNYTPMLDLKILFQTVLVVLRPRQWRGATPRVPLLSRVFDRRT